MTKPIRVDSEAQAELRDAVRWYEQQRRGLGATYLEEVARALELIQRSPGAGTPVPKLRQGLPARRVLLRRYPYSVVYLDQDDHLYVLAFAHTRRRPGYWHHRSS